MKLIFNLSMTQTFLYHIATKEQSTLPSVKALMPTMLVQEHKDKTITHTVHEVLMWFGQPCLCPRMNMRTQCIQKEVGVAPQKYEP